jgi:16S rRNA G966 N2-methylase RsmD
MTTKTKPKKRRGVSPERLEQLANNMRDKIANKLNPAIGNQNHTARRARIAAGMRREGMRLEEVRRARLQMARAIRNDSLPAKLVGVYSEGDLLEILYEPDPHDQGEWATKRRELHREEREWLKGTDDFREQLREDERRRELRDSILSQKIPGFFPTPDELADRMADWLDIRFSEEEVLEPNAGMGALIEAVIRKHGDQFKTIAVELNYTLCEYLRANGHEVHQADILEASGQVDHVIMNPPYEKGQDMDHTRHCYNLLKPGGRLVTLISTGYQFRSDKRATAFREWLESDETIVLHEETIENAFKGSQSLKQTGVRVALIVIDKPIN